MGILRILLAITVIAGHADSPIFGYWFVGGTMAVQIFFVISGFYMSLILNEKYTGKNSYKLFITNRFLRLYPIYWIVAFITLIGIISILIAHGTFSGTSYEKIKSMNIFTIIFMCFTNVCMFFQDTVMFLGVNWSTGALYFTTNFKETMPHLSQFLLVPQAWSLGVELLFYLIAPFVVRRKASLILILISFSVALRAVIYYKFGLKGDPWTYRFFPTELAFFLTGALSYKIYKRIKSRYSALTGGKYYCKMAFVLMLSFTLFYQFVPLPWKVKYLLYFAVFFVTVPFIFILTKDSKIDRYIGELSYPVYISHILILNVMQKLKMPQEGGLAINAAILTILFAVILNEFVAKRIEVIRQRRITAAV